MERDSPARLEVSLGALRENRDRLVRQAGRAQVALVAKANAYGAGAAAIVTLLGEQAGVVFTAWLDEALALRPCAPGAMFCVLHGFDPGQTGTAGIIPVIGDHGMLARWREAARTAPARPGVAIHLDTGMGRAGLDRAGIRRLVEEPELLSGLRVVFWLSHYACAEQPDHPLNRRQRARMVRALAQLPPAPASMCNSCGLFLGEDPLDLVRPGGALLGYNPCPGRPNPMRQAMTLVAPVLDVREIPRNGSVGYGAGFVARRRSTVIHAGLGYGDAGALVASAGMMVLVEGRPAPVIGRISMDMLAVDVTDLGVPVHPGGRVVLFGEELPVDVAAGRLGRPDYSLSASISPRVSRRYLP